MSAQHPNHNEPDPLAQSRMSLGEHIEELRSCMLKSLAGMVVGFGVCLFFGNDIFGFLAQPLLLALHMGGQRPELYVSTLPEAFVTYIRVSLYAGIFLSSPWIFHQLWGFVASGLYPHERRYVTRVAPFSLVLFLLGGLFFIMIVAPISCSFFIRFGSRIKTPQLHDNFLTRTLSRSITGEQTIPPPSSSLVPPPTPVTPDLPDQAIHDPCAPQHQQASAPARPPLVKPLFTLQKYVSLVLLLSLVFGLAFQMPLIVLFLGRLSLVSIHTFTTMRRYVFFAILVVSALITPPDVISQIALTLPMYLLYELGILLLRLWGPGKSAEAPMREPRPW